MTLIPYNKNDIEEFGGFKKTKNQKILEEFVNSNMDCAEVKEFTQKDSHGCAASLNISIKRFKLLNIHAISRGGRVFLIKNT